MQNALRSAPCLLRENFWPTSELLVSMKRLEILPSLQWHGYIRAYAPSSASSPSNSASAQPVAADEHLASLASTATAAYA